MKSTSIGLAVQCLIMLSPTIWPIPNAAAAAEDGTKDCRVDHTENLLTLSNESFRWTIDISNGPKAVACENRLTGTRIDLHGGEEASLRFSGAREAQLREKGQDKSGHQRLELVDWRQAPGGDEEEDPSQEMGFAKGYHQPDFNDYNWPLTSSPWELNHGAAAHTIDIPRRSGFNWFRHRLNLPTNADGQIVDIVLGGCGIYDFGNQRVFVNGELVGAREIEQKWQEPGIFRLTPGDPAYKALRFEQPWEWKPNVIAVQAWNCFDNRPRSLRELDQGRWFTPSRELRLQEHFVTVGEAYRNVSMTRVTDVDVQSEGEEGRVRLGVETSLPGLNGSLWYEWNASEPALHKWLELDNRALASLMLEVNLGQYAMDLPSTEGFRGFPVYINGEIYCSIAHPAGVAQGGYGTVRLCHFPGQYLWPGDSYTTKKAVIGFAETGGAVQAFRDYIIRRAPRKAQSYVMWNGLGTVWARPPWYTSLSVDWQTTDPATEQKLMSQLDKMEELQKSPGLFFDIFWIDAGWRTPEVFPFITGQQQYNGRLRPAMKQFSRSGWPEGPGNMIERIEGLGMRLGLWLGQGHMGCHSLLDTQQIWREAFRHHIQVNHVAGFKFDGMIQRCWSVDHNHLPGKYSIEMCADGKINVYNYARKLDPDIQLIFFYGHDSPWWLLWGNSIYDWGVGMEAASPTFVPTPLTIRNSVAVGLDQALQFDADVPPQGKNSLGIWFSKTVWNNYIGPKHWLPAMVMDISRGNAVANPWVNLKTDIQSHEYPILAHLTRLLKSSPDCFLNTSPILGSAWNEEPYGYLGSSGRKSFVTVNNPTWRDREISVELGPDLGLVSQGKWEIYMHFPVIGRVTAPDETASQVKRVWHSGERLSWRQSPFEVSLLEITPAGDGSVMDKSWEEFRLPVEPWDHPARELVIRANSAAQPSGDKTGRQRSIVMDIPPHDIPGLLALVLRMTQDGHHHKANYFSETSLSGTIGGGEVGPAGPDNEFPIQYTTTPEKQTSSWIVFEIPLEASQETRHAELVLWEKFSDVVSVETRAHLLHAQSRMAGDFF